MKKLFLVILGLVVLVGCAEHDPILDGKRHAVFETEKLIVLNKKTPVSDKTTVVKNTKRCPYTQDKTNTIWSGKTKIFTGFSSKHFVESNQSPICTGSYLYTGLTTGEVIKVNVYTQRVEWMTDLFKLNSVTGGTGIVDIVAHVVKDSDSVYAGGLGDMFCKLRSSDGDKIWCVAISVPVDFVVTSDAIFVVGADNVLYALNKNNGMAYWKTEVKNQVQPVYKDQILIIGTEKINAVDGTIINIQ
ncbi:MAG: PQQ-like beta-propeller repeat protein [Alphaproteobacteria bacterium]|nr:PQQ-like beta-propeller repeat protein [Alphaproteobacteria bacterium]